MNSGSVKLVDHKHLHIINCMLCIFTTKNHPKNCIYISYIYQYSPSPPLQSDQRKYPHYIYFYFVI